MFIDAFSTALWNDQDVPPSTELLPEHIARACVRALPVDGAGLTLTGSLRVPIGASDPASTLIEQLQATLGDGPCIDATSTGKAVTANSAEIADRWPVFAEALGTRTRFRSLASAPLTAAEHRIGALDIYSRAPDITDLVPLGQLCELAEHIRELLLLAPTDSVDAAGEQPVWLNTLPAVRRMQVWQAVGMICIAYSLPAEDAVAGLRGAAFSRNRSMDQLAEDLIERRITPEELELG